MPGLKTRACTEVYTSLPPPVLMADPQHLPRFEERPIPKVDMFLQRKVKDRKHLTRPELRVMLEQLIRTHAKTVNAGRDMPLRVARVQPAWRDRVNAKRRLIALCIRNQRVLNLQQVARETRSCPQTVKRVYQDLVDHMPPDTYNYNNLKQAEELARLDRDLKVADGGLISVADIKRRNPHFSRKKILEQLHACNLRWRKLPLGEPKVAFHDPPDPRQLQYVIGQLAQVHSRPDTEMLFVDEMKFPLLQTAKYHWIERDAVSQIKLNRRAVPDTSLTAIAMCSRTRFVAVQLFNGEVRGQDFLYFLNTAIASLSREKTYLVLADNATWHNSSLMQSTKAYPFLFFNCPRMYQLNLIENAFSAVRHEFRKRPTVDTLEEEAQEILQIFFSDHNPPRFAGYFRNHLRMLKKYAGFDESAESTN